MLNNIFFQRQGNPTKGIGFAISAVLVVLALNIRVMVWYLEFTHSIPSVGFTSLLLAITLVAMFFRIRSKGPRLTRIDIAACVVLIYCSVIVLISRYQYGPLLDLDDRSFTDYNIILIAMSILYYVIGRFFLAYALRSRNVLFICWCFLVVFIALHTDFSSFGLDIDKFNEEFKGSHLSLADMFALYSIVLVASSLNKRKGGILAIASAAFLFLLHSRSAFFIFLLSVYITLATTQDRSRWWKTVFLTISIFLTVMGMWWDQIVANERMIGLLLNPLDDSSLLSRWFQFEGGLEDIAASPISGRYGGQIEMYGYIGWYIHNVLSYWRQFGLVPFLFVALSAVYYPWLLIRTSSKYFSQHRHLLLMLFTYSVTSILFSKAFVWYFVWLYVGYASWYFKSLRDYRQNVLHSDLLCKPPKSAHV